MKRKLTTIFCADGVGFGALMEADEEGAMMALSRRREIMRELFAKHDGRQVNTWGDAVIAEFSSVVEAVRCAIDIQEAIATETTLSPPGLAFRIGVNLGDVLLDGDEGKSDIYGDGVNVASRLQELAEPGGVVVSGAVHDLTHKQIAVGFDFLGEQKVKSIDQPVRSYSVNVERRNAPRAVRPTVTEADGETTFAAYGRQADGWLGWLKAQPRRIRVYAGMILFLFAINALFDGLAFPWFVFPSIPFALMIWRHWRRTRPEGGASA